MKVKFIGYAEALQSWYPLMNGDGLTIDLEDNQDPFDYIKWAMEKADIPHYLVTYVVLEN